MLFARGEAQPTTASCTSAAAAAAAARDRPLLKPKSSEISGIH